MKYFLFRCSSYSDIRNKYFHDLKTCYSNKSHEEQYNVFASNNFIYCAMEKRKKLCQ